MASLEVWWGALFGLVLGFAGVVILADAWHRWLRMARILVADPADVATLAGDPDEVVVASGLVHPVGGRVTAPLSGRQCCLVRTSVEYFRPLNLPRWRTIADRTHGERFELADATDRVVVDAADATVAVEADPVESVPPDPSRVPDDLAGLLTDSDGSEYDVVATAGHDLRVSERRVDAGQEVTVLAGVEDGRVRAHQVGGIHGRYLLGQLAVTLFLTGFGLFLTSVVWFVAIPRWAAILGV